MQKNLIHKENIKTNIFLWKLTFITIFCKIFETVQCHSVMNIRIGRP